ncbi:DEAD/DEAH box helicase family protein [Vibrio parahaemolyticus]|uniref:DEAD/DEAH box helicase n=1 Tax=Vibrio parahaemolyticus TaxID=670 RepID=UPI001B819237|nr:DEAD/DEAH box helicase family protein [Vibrio parahaemolyticus]EJE4168343.1 DEAD/DEAH box helicase family protein [Vibrio parahaemolyticus]MCI9705952.1 DEAD/DEAH box helicase family protein [Vibrio parahaemolyticus]MDF5483676.1 DEAD/DEAH box helicase family protein [Vibrio parahaemolyticus]MDG2839241.1 DEAD/DEAH box helicase family protein [Vibrio parahaemolyticus]HBC3357470.1 DEAD/DEAH box helicase family protein [Vibrio parahaemolyticus]
MLRKWQSDCIEAAIKKYQSGSKHFLTQATPGAGKTMMSAYLSKHLVNADMVDIILCFSPSVSVANGFTTTFARVLQCSFNGKLGSLGTSLTYQAIQYLDDSFWETISKYRVLAIFDEIHHCSGETLVEANSWGEQIILKVQNAATYTLALTGTPWRSDCLPICLSSYSDPEGRIICDYQYTLQQAIADNVCRKPKLVLVDNEQLKYISTDEIKSYSSIQAMFKEQKINYSSILQDKDALTYILRLSVDKLHSIRSTSFNAAGLIVAASVAHARQIQAILNEQLKQPSILVSYRDPDAQNIIESFKRGSSPWIISIGMISEGTDIPRLQVCCHLSNVRTELYFRQVLGRILRITDGNNQEAWLYTFAEASLVKFSEEIEQDIPESCLYVKSPKLNEQQSPSSVRADDMPSLVTSTMRGSLVWSDGSGELAVEENDRLFNSFTLGHFRERVIEAFSSL